MIRWRYWTKNEWKPAKKPLWKPFRNPENYCSRALKKKFKIAREFGSLHAKYKEMTGWFLHSNVFFVLHSIWNWFTLSSQKRQFVAFRVSCCCGVFHATSRCLNFSWVSCLFLNNLWLPPVKLTSTTAWRSIFFSIKGSKNSQMSTNHVEVK